MRYLNPKFKKHKSHIIKPNATRNVRTYCGRGKGVISYWEEQGLISNEIPKNDLCPECEDFFLTEWLENLPENNPVCVAFNPIIRRGSETDICLSCGNHRDEHNKPMSFIATEHECVPVRSK